MGIAPKPISKEMCVRAMTQTKSIMAAARYLNCSYQHLKPFMKSYIDEETGKSLFDLHKNQCGKGVPKFMSNRPYGRVDPSIHRILSGELSAAHFSTDKLKHRLLESGLVEEKCECCGFQEHRVTDNKMPLLIHFLDGNKEHFVLANIVFVCYNCFFIYYGRVFNDKDIQSFEEHTKLFNTSDRFDLDLDPYHQEKLKELGLFKDDDIDDPYDLVSRKK
jgi:hypothetical protein